MSNSASYKFLYYPQNFADIIYWNYLVFGAIMTWFIIKYSIKEHEELTVNIPMTNDGNELNSED